MYKTREYICQKCGKRYEKLVKKVVNVFVKCPDCGQQKHAIDYIISPVNCKRVLTK